MRFNLRIIIVLILLLILFGSFIVLKNSNKIRSPFATPTPSPAKNITESPTPITSCSKDADCPAGYSCKEVSACPSAAPGRMHCFVVILKCVKN